MYELDVLIQWSEELLLKFNAAKFNVMHCGTQNPRGAYYMKSLIDEIKALEETHIEKDLGVKYHTLKLGWHCTKQTRQCLHSSC